MTPALIEITTPSAAALVSYLLWSRIDVGAMPLFDLLLLACLVPAVSAFLFARRLPDVAPRGFAVATGILGLVLVFAYLTREV